MMLSHTSARGRCVNPSFVLQPLKLYSDGEEQSPAHNEVINDSSVKGICLIGAMATPWKGSGV